jgi:Fe-S oxidoreductase
MEQRSNPWGIAPAERTKWAVDINAPAFEAGKTEYLFFVGCAGAFDSRNRSTTLALTRIMDAAGISWGILGKEELCCGDSLRRLGNEYIFDRIAKENIKLFNEKGVKKIITQCPHCYSTLKNDYRQYGIELEIIHHSELINNLLNEGRLKLKAVNSGNVLFHDSCYLGRHNDIYEPPRRALAAATGAAPAEMRRHHNNAFCCGAGGGRMWMENRAGKRIDIARVGEAMEENPDIICVSCPYCMTMFEDGVKEHGDGNKVKVLDLAEIVDKALG